jgi:RNA polymerase sigma factor (sigma-70 family)
MSRAALPPFQSLIDAHGADLLGFLRAMAGPQDAEDVFQDTYLAALRAYPEADPRNLRAWIFTIARRKAIDHHRGRARRPEPVAEVDRAGTAAGPEQSAAMNGEVWSQVAALPPKQRAAVALRFVADLRYREIGAALGVSEAAARRNVHDGLRNLRGEITEEAKSR